MRGRVLDTTPRGAPQHWARPTVRERPLLQATPLVTQSKDISECFVLSDVAVGNCHQRTASNTRKHASEPHTS